jgi:hypothetical protein
MPQTGRKITAKFILPERQKKAMFFQLNQAIRLNAVASIAA